MAIKQFNVGVKAVIQKDGKFLVVHSPLGYWDLPGGRIDDEEAIEETLRREIAEELPSSGDVKIGELVCAYRLPGLELPGGEGLVLLMFQTEVMFTDGVKISDEHDEYRWVSVDEAEELGSDFISKTVKSVKGILL